MKTFLELAEKRQSDRAYHDKAIEAEKDGIITKISSPDGEDRYDPHTEKHYHLRCKICGKIIDSTYPYNEIINHEDEDGFLIESHNLEFVGICKECKKKM